MSGQTLDLDKDIMILNRYADKMGQLAIDMLHSIKNFTEFDHLGFMEMTFISKQIEHYESICRLVDAEQYRDAFILTRVMIEGYAVLAWATGESNERPLNWRAYVWLKQYGYLYGKPEYATHKVEIEEALDKYCRQFLKPEFKDRFQSELTPDSYRFKWRMDENEDGKFIEKKIIEIFKEVGLEDLHDTVYTKASGLVHWDSWGMAEAIRREPGGVIRWSEEPKYLGAMSLVSGFHALFGSVKLLDEHFKLGFSDRLKEFFDDFIAKKP